MKLLMRVISIILLSLVSLWSCSIFGSDEPEEYTLSASADPSVGGSVDPSSGTFEEGMEVSVTATASDGWAFKNWTGGIESQDNPLTFEISANTNITANFVDQSSKYAMRVDAISVDDTLSLVFGQALGAGDDLDGALDEEAPPPPPEGAFNAYFAINSLNLLKDYRASNSTKTEWALEYQVGNGNDLKLEWELIDDRQIEGTLTLTDSGGSFEVDMLSESSHTISNSSTSGSLVIKYDRGL